MSTIAVVLFICSAVMIAFALALARVNARADREARRAHQDYLLNRELCDLGDVPIPPEARERGLRAVQNLMDAIQREEGTGDE